jgi:hypothetical protein
VSRWQESIDRVPGRLPVVRATGTDVTYELVVIGGVMNDRLFTPPSRMRLMLRCDDQGGVFVRTKDHRS